MSSCAEYFIAAAIYSSFAHIRMYTAAGMHRVRGDLLHREKDFAVYIAIERGGLEKKVKKV
jgi:hypothetical protein